MKIYSYLIKLLDPLFYSREGVSWAYTPPYLHATAINLAVCYALGVHSENQPYIISEANGGRNTPRYKNSQATEAFYFTPAKLRREVNYLPQIVKGDGEKFISVGYGQTKNNIKSMGNEVLKASRLYFISPETEFEGYVIGKDEVELPQIIRLGSFRGKAELKITREYKSYGKREKLCVDHPVDPLLNNVIRGVMINMFPYPIVDNAIVDLGIEIRMGRLSKYVAFPDSFTSFEEKPKRVKDTMIF
jgi:CRISPR-associated protein Csc1